MTTPFDYDRDPGRFRLASRVTEQHLTGVPSLYELLAGELALQDPPRILDIGCGEGALRAALPARLGARTVGLDASATMLSAHPRPVVQADATALPFVAGGFGAAVAVNVLDHLTDPTAAIREAHRVLAAGGCLLAAVERWDAPLVRLPDRAAVRDYLIARFVAPEAAAAAEQVATPITVTKRGAVLLARK
jgi:SAM-dependent methyltransferase